MCPFVEQQGKNPVKCKRMEKLAKYAIMHELNTQFLVRSFYVYLRRLHLSLQHTLTELENKGVLKKDFGWK